MEQAVIGNAVFVSILMSHGNTVDKVIEGNVWYGIYVSFVGIISSLKVS